MNQSRRVLAMALAVMCAGTSGVASAAALDRSGQPISGFLRPGNYFEYGGTLLSPAVEGVDKDGNATGDMGSSYSFIGATLKFQPTEKFSFGLIYDEPFGAAASYDQPGAFVASPTDVVLSGLPVVTGPSVVANGQLVAYGLNSGIEGNTDLRVNTRNLAILAGFQPTENWNIYAGPVYQQVKGNVSLRGETYSIFNGYDLSIPTESEWGWLAGVAYQIPEIALKVSLTYRSEIDYSAEGHESVPMVAALGANSVQLGGLIQQLVQAGQIPPETGLAIGNALGNLRGGISPGATDVMTPQSVNLDFQSGIMADTILFGNVRWVQWSKFTVRPHAFSELSRTIGTLVGQPNGFNLVDYAEDQWSANLGLGRALTQNLGASVSVGWDSGAGNPVTTLGPTEGFWNLGLGLRYNPTPKTEVSLGVRYFWLGDAVAETSARAYAGDFSDNHALGAGLRFGVNF